ncbi:MAG: phosphatase domain-containing protein [Archangium sp.]
MRSLVLVAFALASTVRAEPAVLLFPVVGTPASVTLSGRVLKHTPSRGSSTFERNLRRLTSSNWDGAQVEIRYAGRAVKTVSGADGNFAATLSGVEKPFPVGLSTAEAQAGGAVGIATVHIVSRDAPFFVISDFDDTLSVTNVLEGSKLIQATFLQDATTQPAVPGMSAFYECLREDKLERPGFALVSGSPAQYLDRVKQFLVLHRFPLGFGVYLRDLGPSTISNYKQPVIRALLKELPNEVVLVGDSGQQDPEIYAQMRTEFPDRVKAIYIHDVGRSDNKERFKNMVLFKEGKDAALDAVARGLVTADCVNQAFAEKK